MAKFPEADARIFNRAFVCKICKSKKKAPNLKVLEGKITCGKCGSSKFRPKKKK